MVANSPTASGIACVAKGWWSRSRESGLGRERDGREAFARALRPRGRSLHRRKGWPGRQGPREGRSRRARHEGARRGVPRLSRRIRSAAASSSSPRSSSMPATRRSASPCSTSCCARRGADARARGRAEAPDPPARRGLRRRSRFPGGRTCSRERAPIARLAGPLGEMGDTLRAWRTKSRCERSRTTSSRTISSIRSSAS